MSTVILANITATKDEDNSKRRNDSEYVLVVQEFPKSLPEDLPGWLSRYLLIRSKCFFFIFMRILEMSQLRRSIAAHKPLHDQQEDFSELRTVLNVLTELEKEVPDVNTFTYEQLDWSKRSLLLARSSSETLDKLPKDHGFNNSRDIRSGSGGAVASHQIIVIELFLPTVFRAVTSFAC
ncbi:hypothetical protein Tco_0890925 [Tanacetum coccineum]|uniref:Uncharacterized protein n=1 Tax=Tanacetum coccineum TaxID=301880 RepID=A0ABQ5C4W0_9ASTR